MSDDKLKSYVICIFIIASIFLIMFSISYPLLKFNEGINGTGITQPIVVKYIGERNTTILDKEINKEEKTTVRYISTIIVDGPILLTPIYETEIVKHYIIHTNIKDFKVNKRLYEKAEINGTLVYDLYSNGSTRVTNIVGVDKTE